MNLWVSLVVLLVGNAAFAAGGACQADFKKFCGGPPNIQCLKEKRSQFSRKCQAEIEGRLVAVKRLENACSQEAKQFCFKEMGPARLDCLQRNEVNLSAACKSALKDGPRFPAGKR